MIHESLYNCYRGFCNLTWVGPKDSTLFFLAPHYFVVINLSFKLQCKFTPYILHPAMTVERCSSALSRHI